MGLRRNRSRPFVSKTYLISPSPPSRPLHLREERYLYLYIYALRMWMRLVQNSEKADRLKIVEAKERLRFIFNASAARVWSYSERPVPVSEQHCARSKGHSVYLWRPEVIPLFVNILAMKGRMSSGRHEYYTSSMMIYLQIKIRQSN